MNIELTEKQRIGLGKLVLRWARQNKLIAENEQLVIQLSRKSIAPVVFLPDTERKPSLTPEQTDRIMPEPIKSLGLSSRTLNPLINNRCFTIGLVARKSEQQLRTIRGVGFVSINELRDKLAAIGINLGDNYRLGKEEHQAFLDLFLDDDASWHYLQVILGPYNHSSTWDICRFICNLTGLRWRDLGSQDKAKLAADMLAKTRGTLNSTDSVIEEISSLFVKLKIPQL